MSAIIPISEDPDEWYETKGNQFWGIDDPDGEDVVYPLHPPRLPATIIRVDGRYCWELPGE